MSRYLAAYTPSENVIYPPFINFTELGGGNVRVIVRSPSVLIKITGRDDELFPDSGPVAQIDIDKDELKKMLTAVLEKLNDE